MQKTINKMNIGSIFTSYKIYSINNNNLDITHNGYKLFVKVGENKDGIMVLPMINTKNYYNESKYKDYTLKLMPDKENNLKNISYINCASEVYFLNKEYCKYVKEIGNLSEKELLEAKDKLVQAGFNGVFPERIEVKFDEQINEDDDELEM